MLVLILSTIIILALIVTWYRDTFIVKRQLISVSLPQLTLPLSVCQLTDLHGHMFKGSFSLLIRQITKDQPDVIVLTGDMIDRKTESFTDVLYLIDHLVTIAPVYFVMGNHEVSHPKQNAFLNALTEAGVCVLHNESVSFNHRRDTIRLVGVGDASSLDADLSLAFADVNATDATILLSHTPDIVDQLSTEPVTLILSGHTHGGQIRLPLIGALIAPGKGLFKRRTKGLYSIPNKRLLYIDSGLGMSRIPVRLFNQSQYTVIDVTPEET